MAAPRRAIALIAVLCAGSLALVIFLATRHGGDDASVVKGDTVPACPPGSDAAPPPGSVPLAPGAATPPTPGATSVAAHGAKGDGVADETQAFVAAFDIAARCSPVRFPEGPAGRPQAVVYVPPGTYRLTQPPFPADTRLEVDAGAVLQPVARDQAATRGGPKIPALFVWDGPAEQPLVNVSLVGVGEGGGPLKDLAGPVEPGWDITRSFTLNLDAAQTGGDNDTGAVMLINVKGFLIENVFSVQNATIPVRPEGETKNLGQYPWPTSSRAVFVLRPRNDSPKEGPFHDPHDGVIRHHYNVNAPYGYGPNQIASAHNVRFSTIYSRGGTALRLETDATLKKDFGGEVRGLSADTIVGVDCNRAVSFAPHGQKNYDVRISGVTARGCHQGVIESLDEDLGKALRGGFWDSSLASIEVVGSSAAQNPVAGRRGTWESSTSQQAFARDKKVDWSVRYDGVRCSGSFLSESDPIDVGGRFERPTCQ